MSTAKAADSGATADKEVLGPMRMAYVYLMKDDPARVRPVAPEHAAYWHGLALDSYEGGPFADRSGGLITFLAASTEEAEAWVAGDPFVGHDLLVSAWLKQWVTDEQVPR